MPKKLSAGRISGKWHQKVNFRGCEIGLKTDAETIRERCESSWRRACLPEVLEVVLLDRTDSASNRESLGLEQVASRSTMASDG